MDVKDVEGANISFWQTGKEGDAPAPIETFRQGYYDMPPVSLNAAKVWRSDVIIELVADGAMPEYKTEGSAGADVRSRINVTIKSGETNIVPLGFKVSSPDGTVMLLCQRSGLSLNTPLRLANSVGVIDSDYADEVGAIFWNSGDEDVHIKKGDRVAQVLFFDVARPLFVNGVVEKTTTRDGGFGSTGSK